MVKTWEGTLLNLSEEHVSYMRDDTLAAHKLLWQAALGEQFKPNDQVPDLGGLNVSITTFWLMNEAFTLLADIYQSLDHSQEIQDLATEAYQNGFAFVGQPVEKSQIEKRLLEQHSIVAPQPTRGGPRL